MLSIWERTGFQASPHVAVVGGGIVGLFTALHYQRRHPDHRVLVLEAGSFPAGASVKNAGFACFGSPSELLHDIIEEGEDRAVARVEERWNGLRELRAELGDAAIGFEACGGHELFRADDPLYTRVAGRFDALNAALRPIFGAPVYAWRDADISHFGLQAGHLAHTPLEGAVDSGRLMRTLLAKVQAAGVLVRTCAPVRKVTEDASGATVELGDGSLVKAGQVVLAVNGYLRHLLPDADVMPGRGQVLLTAPIAGLRLRGTYHADEGYYYFRDYQGRVLLGGGRHLDKAGETTTENTVTPRIQQALEYLLRNVILPGQPFTIEQRWSGVMGFRTQGKEPLVERRTERTVVAAGLSGMGVAIGIRVARRAAALLD
ncbi:MAG: FAD-dependent oxidoreductase [Flavobacteriales bacterium]